MCLQLNSIPLSTWWTILLDRVSVPEAPSALLVCQPDLFIILPHPLTVLSALPIVTDGCDLPRRSSSTKKLVFALCSVCVLTWYPDLKAA